MASTAMKLGTFSVLIAAPVVGIILAFTIPRLMRAERGEDAVSASITELEDSCRKSPKAAPDYEACFENAASVRKTQETCRTWPKVSFYYEPCSEMVDAEIEEARAVQRHDERKASEIMLALFRRLVNRFGPLCDAVGEDPNTSECVAFSQAKSGFDDEVQAIRLIQLRDAH
jgi:hypothetical protein